MLPVVYVADQNAVRMMIISAASVKKHNPDAHFIVLSENTLEMSQFFFVVGRNYTNYVCQIPVLRANAPHISNAAYLKLWIPEVLKNYSKCLYLDADTVCQGDLSGLDIYQTARPLGMCESHNFGKVQASWHSHSRYYNSGVMVMNLDRLRETDFRGRCMNYIDVSIPNYCEDETLINCAMYQEIEMMPQKYNYCHNRTYDRGVAMNEKDAVILHFIGSDKSGMFRWGAENL